MDRIESLKTFARVVECGSFTKAADTLQIPRSTVSTAIRELESRVGARLLNRTTRRVALTTDGEDFYRECLQLLDDYERLEGSLRGAGPDPAGKLHVNVPGRMGRLIFVPALPAFLARYPRLEIELGVTDREVDLIQEGVDCVVRVGELRDSSLVARRVGELDVINCASPGYLEAHGAPRRTSDLNTHFAVNYASPTSGRVEEWEYLEKGEMQTRSMKSKVIVNNADGYIACCIAGLGLIQVPEYDVRDHIACGDLVEVLPRHRAAPMPLSLVYPERRHVSQRLSVFLDWAEQMLKPLTRNDSR